MYFRLVGGARWHSLLDGEAEDAFPAGLKTVVAILRQQKNMVPPCGMGSGKVKNTRPGPPEP